MDIILEFKGSTNKQRISSDYEGNFDNPALGELRGERADAPLLAEDHPRQAFPVPKLKCCIAAGSIL
jgi:hypothetical protein